MEGFLLSILLSASVFCQKPATVDANLPEFENIPQKKSLEPQTIKEASGMADGRANAGVLWVIEDSGNPPEMIRVGHDGTVKAKVFLKNAANRDWEAMELYSSHQKNTICIGDIGDNEEKFEEYYFYELSEPLEGADTVTEVAKIAFRYPDGSHDAEAFLVDPINADIYIITKRDSKSRIYRLGRSFQNGVNTAEFKGELPYNGVTAACLSPDGMGIIIKTYFSLNYYTVRQGENISDALKGPSRTLPYVMEPQGEAVSFASDNSGYFTLSEAGLASKVDLYFYKRKKQ